MKPRRIVTLSAAVAALMLVSAACGTASPPNPASSTVPSSSAASTAGNSETSSPGGYTYDTTPVTLTILGQDFALASNGVQKDPVAEQIRKVTGITLNVTGIDDPTALTNKISAEMASDSLEDIVYMPSNTVSNNAIGANRLADLTDLVSQYAPIFTSNAKLAWNVSYAKKYLSNDTGRLYIVPAYTGLQNRPNAPVLASFTRWDYYKGMGYPAVTDKMSWLDVLTQMQKAHPTGSDGKPSYAVSFGTDWGSWFPVYACWIDGYYTNIAEPLQVDISNNNVTSLYTDPNSDFWSWMKFYNKASQTGELDPNSSTQTVADSEAMVTNGNVMAYIESWNSFKTADADQGYAILNINPDSDKYYYNSGTAGSSWIYSIAANSKNVDRALELFQYLASPEGCEVANNGVEGQAWTVGGDNKPVFTAQYLADGKTMDSTAYIEAYGAQRYKSMCAFASGETDPNYNCPYDFSGAAWNIAANSTNMQNDAAQKAGETFNAQKLSQLKFSSYMVVPGLPPLSTDLNTISTNSTNYINQNWVQVIMSKTDADFTAAQTKFISDLDALGFETLYNKDKSDFESGLADLQSLGTNPWTSGS